MTIAHALTEEELDPVHRALIELVVEREYLPFLKRVAHGLTAGEAAESFRHLLRFELVTIPAGTPAARCRWCAQPIYWLPSRAHKHYRESISVDGDGCRAPSADRDGEGFPHLSDCAHSGLRIIEATARV